MSERRPTLNLLLPVLVLLVASAATPAAAQPQRPVSLDVGELDHAFQTRRDSLIDFYQDRVAPDLAEGGYFDIAANLYRRTNIDWAVARLDTLMQAPRGDMFWMYPFTTVMYAGRDVLPEATKRKMHDLWRTYRPYRGDTENHWAMYYATLYLAAQMYPDEPGEQWFTGKTSQGEYGRGGGVPPLVDGPHHDDRTGGVRLAALHARLHRPDGAALRLRRGPGHAAARRDDARLPHRRLRR